MPNWKNIEKLRNRLARQKNTKYHRFQMHHFIKFISGVTLNSKVTAARLRRNGRGCGTACCLAGETLLMFAAHNKTIPLEVLPCADGNTLADREFVQKYATDKLGLKPEEAVHMFYGHWARIAHGHNLAAITRKDAIKYLTKAINAKDIMVTLDMVTITA